MPVQTPRTTLENQRVAIRAVLAEFGVTSAGVFGSVARGEDGPESDLDIIVEFEKGARRDVIRLADALTTLTGLDIDVVDYERVRDHARKTGIGGTILQETVPL